MRIAFIALCFLAGGLVSCGGASDTQVEEKVENAADQAQEKTEELMEDMEDEADTLMMEADSLSDQVEGQM